MKGRKRVICITMIAEMVRYIYCADVGKLGKLDRGYTEWDGTPRDIPSGEGGHSEHHQECSARMEV